MNNETTYNIRQYPSGGGASIDLGNHTLDAAKVVIEKIESDWLVWEQADFAKRETFPQSVQYLESCDFSAHDIDTDEIVADYGENQWDLAS